ncbi:hypothetical protein D3C76_962590 [compost metagenome]
MPVMPLITSWVSLAPRSSMIARSATLTEAGVSRAVRPRREPVLIGVSRTTPDGCSWTAVIVLVGRLRTVWSAQAKWEAPSISTKEVLVFFMNDFHANM